MLAETVVVLEVAEMEAEAVRAVARAEATLINVRNADGLMGGPS